MEFLVILLIVSLSLGVIVLGYCFVGGIAFCLGLMSKIVSKIFGSDKEK